MHIALLNDPNNFHTQKWARALEGQGAKVTVFSFDPDRGSGLDSVTFSPSVGDPGFNYRSYLRNGKALKAALDSHQIDLVNALNVTPFGVWAARSGFRPFIASAIGADILEYPPSLSTSPILRQRSWSSQGKRAPWKQRIKQRLARRFYRARVAEALQAADLITGDNQQLVDAVREWFGIPPPMVRVLRWGVEPELFEVSERRLGELRKQLGIAEGRKLVFSPRGAKLVYNGDTVVEAFGKVLAEGREDAHFLMLASGYDIPPEVEAKARELEEAHANFTFVRKVMPREDIYALWNMVDIFLNVPAYDGYSAALAEGRFIGAIPIVNDIPAHRELLVHQENAWMISDMNSENLAGGIRKMLNETAIWKERFGPKNQKWIRENSLISENADLFLSWAEMLLG